MGHGAHLGLEKTRPERWRKTNGHTTPRKRYPIAVRVLELASLALFGTALGGAIYGLYLGVPIPDQNRFIGPTVVVGGTLLVLTFAWMHRLDNKLVT